MNNDNNKNNYDDCSYRVQSQMNILMNKFSCNTHSPNNAGERYPSFGGVLLDFGGGFPIPALPYDCCLCANMLRNHQWL
jgi:hypothetical protein